MTANLKRYCRPRTLAFSGASIHDNTILFLAQMSLAGVAIAEDEMLFAPHVDVTIGVMSVP